MPSFGEIFTVSGVDVISGVDVKGICVWVTSGSTVAVGAAVGGGGVAALWQAAKTKIKRNGMIFFMCISLVLRGWYIFSETIPSKI